LPMLTGPARRRAYGAADPDAAARAGDVLDHHGLAKPDRQMIGKDTRDRVSDPAGRYRHNDGDRPRRIGLRSRNTRHSRQRGSARCEMEKISAGGVVKVPPPKSAEAAAPYALV